MSIDRCSRIDVAVGGNAQSSTMTTATASIIIIFKDDTIVIRRHGLRHGRSIEKKERMNE
jgi:hypothetical protein